MRKAPGEGRALLVEEEGGLRAPRAGEIMRNPALARTFRALAEAGKPAFYSPDSRICRAVVEAVQERGGWLSATDMATFYGNIRFSEAGNNIAKPMVLRQIQDGKYVVVAPSKWASHEVNHPRMAP